MEKQIDARGLACPKPVILAKKGIEESVSGDILTVLVDNEIAAVNLRKLAGSVKAEYSMIKKGEKEFEIQITVKEGGKEAHKEEPFAENCQVPRQGEKTVAVIASEKMGEGDEELGRLLMKGFLYALTQLDRLPETILFYNGGAHLTCEGSPALEDLKTLEKLGVEILTCGTCLNHYKIADKLAVGASTNMYVIAEIQMKADKLIRP